MGYYGIIGLQFTIRRTVMLHDITIKLHQILNEIFPKLGCGYYSDEEEVLLQSTYTLIKEINDRNHAFLFGVQRENNICVDCNREADELNSEGRCDDCEAQLDEWEEERKRDGYVEDSPTIEDQYPRYGEHMAEASPDAWDEYWSSKK
jgi:hypothetical protein